MAFYYQPYSTNGYNFKECMDFDEDEGENDMEDNDDEFKQYANKRDINWEPISSIILQKRK